MFAHRQFNGTMPGRAEIMAGKQGSIATGETQSAPAAQDGGPSPEPGHVFGGKYRIEGLIGKGGMGAVYHSTHLVSGKRVAVKWMLPAASATEELAERFLREARATARIDHPNVVDIYDVGTQDGSVYLVMELLRGESLADRLVRDGSMDATEACAVLMHALRAVGAAHAQGVIHRDLKPDNIFMCVGADGEPREPKVVDFGISKIADARDMSLTQSGMVMGTPYYMSPEQVRGLRDVDERGDVYAFGVILYEMITGKHPFDAETYNQLILKIVTEEPTPLASLRPDVDPKLAEVIARAMARNRDDRYPSVSALANDLEPFAGGVTFRRSSSLPSVTPMISHVAPRISHAQTPLTTERPVPRAPSRAGRYVLIALLALAALGAGAWWGFTQTARGPQRAEVTPEERIAPPAAAAPASTVTPAAQPAAIAAPAVEVPQPAAAEAPAPANTAPTTTPIPTPTPTPSRASRRHTPETAESATPAAAAPNTKQSLPADWDERLPTTAPQSPGGSAAGKLGRDDL
jgi:serine/threonine-protein kinase